MSKPLIITDCDEVLLHMAAPFRDWLGETQGISFSMAGGDFSNAMTRTADGSLVAVADMWPLLNLFFDSEMHRQLPIPGAVAALEQLAERADIVVLTNLLDHRKEPRTQQLATHGINFRVYTNQGPKGPALNAILDEFRPSRAIFIDDLAQHHGSVMELAPHVKRLHLCGEPQLAPHIACAHAAGHADARIDDWALALPWLLDQLTAETEQPEGL
jgi:hypothetical protein